MNEKKLKITLLTGGKDPHYAFGLVSGLLSHNIEIDLIGSDEMRDYPHLKSTKIRFLNLRGNTSKSVSIIQKIRRVFLYYCRLIRYTIRSDADIFHILWFNTFPYFDMTLLNGFYRLMGKSLVFTAHNINIKERDGGDSWLNRKALNLLYGIVDHIFVHTQQMKALLLDDFNVPEKKITTIPYGMNNAVPCTSLTRSQARERLQLGADTKTILFFGNIARYKGLEYLIQALAIAKNRLKKFRLIIAGSLKKKDSYWNHIQQLIDSGNLNDNVIEIIQYIPDEDIEIYFKASDVLILPYLYIFQTGVLFLSFQFGLPAICADVGCIKEDIDEGLNGLLCNPEDPTDLSEKIESFFNSDLYLELDHRRQIIRDVALAEHSWDSIGLTILEAYKGVLGNR